MALTPRQERVLRMIHGVQDGKPQARAEVAKAFDVSPEKIGRIIAQAYRRVSSDELSKLAELAPDVARGRSALLRKMASRQAAEALQQARDLAKLERRAGALVKRFQKQVGENPVAIGPVGAASVGFGFLMGSGRADGKPWLTHVMLPGRENSRYLQGQVIEAFEIFPNVVRVFADRQGMLAWCYQHWPSRALRDLL